MVIRITAHNKKCTNRLMSFARLMDDCDMYYTVRKSMRKDKVANDRCAYTYLKNLVALNEADKNQENAFLEIVASKFQTFCTDFPFVVLSDNEKDFLLDNTSIELLYNFIPKDENEEVVYIFPKAYSRFDQTIIL